MTAISPDDRPQTKKKTHTHTLTAILGKMPNASQSYTCMQFDADMNKLSIHYTLFKNTRIIYIHVLNYQ